MIDQDKSRQELIEELAEMRRRVAVLEPADTNHKQIEAGLQAQEALAEREARLLEAQEVASLGFYFWDIAADRWTSSPVLDRIFDVPADYEKTIDGWANLVHPDERQETLDHLLKEVVGAKQPCDREYRIVRYGDKQVRWVHGLGRLQFNADGQPVAMLGTIQDITQRKQAEEALQKAHDELEQRVKQRTAELAKANENLDIFRKFADTSGQGFSMADLDGKLLYLNPTLCRMLGEERQEAWIGRHLSVCYSEEASRRGKQEIEPALMRNGFWQGELPILSRQGKSIPTWHNGFVIRDEKGSPLCLAVVITDITQRKIAEEALRKEHRNLKHLLRSSDHERQLIAYEIHDGLAQQLAAAIMQIQAFAHLKDKHPKQAAKAFEAGLTMLRQGHFEARRLIAGVRPPILDEAGVVEAIAHLVHEQSRSTGQKIDSRSRVDFGRLDPTLENAIYRIAQEGLANAGMHSKSDKVRVSLVQRADRVRLEIRDWGVGFDPKSVSKSRFGLEGIRQRARLLGGKCRIRSGVGTGTRVTVELPAAPRDEEE